MNEGAKVLGGEITGVTMNTFGQVLRTDTESQNRDLAKGITHTL